MPLVRISLRKGKSDSEIHAIANGVHEAMVATINVPTKDRFQIITEHESGRLIADPTYLDIARSDDTVIIEINLLSGRTAEMKQALYRQIAENLAAASIRPEDILIVLNENSTNDWSFGLGEAQFANRTYEEIRGIPNSQNLSGNSQSVAGAFIPRHLFPYPRVTV